MKPMRKFQISSVVLCKWIKLTPQFQNTANAKSLGEKLINKSIPIIPLEPYVRYPFISVSSNGMVYWTYLYKTKREELWVTLEHKIDSFDANITKVEMVSLSYRSACITFKGGDPRFSNYLFSYEVHVDYRKKAIMCAPNPISTLELPFPKIKTPLTQHVHKPTKSSILYPDSEVMDALSSNTGSLVAHYAYHPSDRTLLYILVEDVITSQHTLQLWQKKVHIPKYSVPLDVGNAQEDTNSLNMSHEISNLDSIDLLNAFDFRASGALKTYPSLYEIEDWVHKQSLELRKPKDIESNRVTFMNLSNRFICFGWSSGHISIHDITRLELIDILEGGAWPSKSRNSNVHKKRSYSELKENPMDPTSPHDYSENTEIMIPICIEFSPNKTCIAVLYNDLTLDIFHLSLQLGRSRSGLATSLEVSNILVTLIETAFLLSTTWWDIVVVLLGFHMNNRYASLYKQVIIRIMNDFDHMNDAYRKKYTSHLEFLKSDIYRSSLMHETNYLDSQVVIHANWMVSTIRYCFDNHRIVEELSRISDTKILESKIASVKVVAEDTDFSVCCGLLEFSFTLFHLLTKRIISFTELYAMDAPSNMDSDTMSMIYSVKQYFAADESGFPMSIFFNETFISQIRELSIYTYIALKQLKKPTDRAHVHFELFSKCYNIVRECLSHFPKDNVTPFTISEFKENIKKKFMELKCDDFRPLELNELIPPRQRFLEFNYFEEMPTKNCFFHNSSVKHLQRNNMKQNVRMDTLTKRYFNANTFKQCVKCNRITQLGHSGITRWMNNWKFSCPFCGGRWTIETVEISHHM